MKIRGVKLAELSHDIIAEYISSLQNTCRYVYSPLRIFLLDLYTNGHTSINLSLALSGLSEKKVIHCLQSIIQMRFRKLNQV